MPVLEAFKVVKGGFTTLAGEVDHAARAGIAALRRQLAALNDQVDDLPIGVVAYTPTVGDGDGLLALTSTAVVIATLSDVSMTSGRRFRFSLGVRAFDVDTTGETLLITLQEDGFDMTNGDKFINAAIAGLYGGGATMSWIVDGDGAAHDYTVTAKAFSGTGNMHSQQSPSSFFMCEDIGPT